MDRARGWDSVAEMTRYRRVDGTLVRANPMFESLFRFAPGTAAGQTMFSLTAPSDLPKTMQVCPTVCSSV